MLSSLQAVRPCSKFSMISLPYWEYMYVHLAIVIGAYWVLRLLTRIQCD